jgi:hypothetical protein
VDGVPRQLGFRYEGRGTRVVAAHVPPSTWATVRQLGIEQQKSVQELVVEALDDLFAKHQRR